jgi:uncharacterized membrane protein (DUF2068 family)
MNKKQLIVAWEKREGKIKKRLLGIKLLCIWYICVVCIGSAAFFLFFQQFLMTKMLNMPKEFKEQVIKTELFKRLNITSIEEFDKFFGKHKKLSSNITVVAHALILLVLTWGLWNLKEWSRIGAIIFEIYKAVSRIWVMPKFAVVGLSGLVGQIAALTTSLLIVIYLTRPKVKEQFK